MPKYIEKECEVHGITKYIKVKNSRGSMSYHCVKCKANKKRKYRRLLKEKAIFYKGGKCLRCNYNKCISALEFHHLDPSQKEFSLAKGQDMLFENLKPELDKCILVCANCHREIHEELLKCGD